MKLKRSRKDGPAIAGRRKAGLRKRRCHVCDRKVWYVQRLRVPMELRHEAGDRIPLVADALVCDDCLDRNSGARDVCDPLEVAVADVRELAPKARKRTCRTCIGQGCRRCDGRGSVEVAP